MTSGEKSFVLFPLGKRRFALRSETVTELARPDRPQSFPHTSRLLSGVLLRRGRIVPVCDVAQLLLGPGAPARKFYLIASRQFGPISESTAIPVTGQCELVKAAELPVTGRMPEYVTGIISLPEEIVEVVDLEKLIAIAARGEQGAEAQP